jgi:hypothetical protein
VLPGSYRARVYYGNLGLLTGGNDHYKVVLWNAEPSPLLVLKQASVLPKIDSANVEPQP